MHEADASHLWKTHNVGMASASLGSDIASVVEANQGKDMYGPNGINGEDFEGISKLQDAWCSFDMRRSTWEPVL